jgi:uncharacterized SAM-binding protein YcdF (DUF218 family)
MIGFLLKKIVSRLLFPMPLCAALLLSGALLLLLSRRWQRLGLGLVLAGTVALVAIGYGFPARSVLRRLEWRYPPPPPDWTLADVPGAAGGSAWVAVLGSGMNEDAALPANSRFDARFLARVMEGVRLVRQVPEATLILSLPGPNLSVEHKQTVAEELCRTLGLAPDKVRLVTTALDTEDEARAVAAMVGTEPLALVTSASHMLRALRLFEGVGLRPAPCPTDFLTLRPGVPRRFDPTAFYPSADNAYASERTVYECLGLAWARLRGQMSPRAPRP